MCVLALLPQFSNQGHQLGVSAGDFPWFSLGWGLSRFGILLGLVCRSFLRAGVFAVRFGKIRGGFLVVVSFLWPVLASSCGPRPLEVLLWLPHILCAGVCIGLGSASCGSPAVCLLRQSTGARSLLCVSLRSTLHQFRRASLSREKGRIGVSLR